MDRHFGYCSDCLYNCSDQKANFWPRLFWAYLSRNSNLWRKGDGDGAYSTRTTRRCRCQTMPSPIHTEWGQGLQAHIDPGCLIRPLRNHMPKLFNPNTKATLSTNPQPRWNHRRLVPSQPSTHPDMLTTNYRPTSTARPLRPSPSAALDPPISPKKIGFLKINFVKSWYFGELL